MEKRKFGLFVMLGITAIFTGCNNIENTSNAYDLINQKEVTINWKGSDDEIESLSTNVTVYNMNNRKDTALKKVSSYKLSTKLINNEPYTRLDMTSSGIDGQCYSVVSDSKEMILFNTETEEIQRRLNTPVINNDFSFLQTGLGFGKTNLDFVRNEAKKLAFDISEDEESSKLVVSLPGDRFSTANQTRISTKVCYDSKKETLSNIETVDVRIDGSTVTTSVEFLYEECEGNYVKIGSITTIDTSFAEKAFDLPDNIKTYDSMEDIPIINEKDFKKMQENGNIFEQPSIKFGDISDMSSKETVVEVYEDIEVNNMSDSVFKFLF